MTAVSPSSSSDAASRPLSAECVLLLGMGLGSEHFVSELLNYDLSLVIVDAHPQLSPALQERIDHNPRVHVIAQSFASWPLLQGIVSKYHVTQTLAMPVGSALTFLGQVNDHYGFAGPSQEQIAACTNKAHFHEVVRSQNLADASYQEIMIEALASQPQAVVAAEPLPVVIKPTFGSGSQGVSICRSLQDVAQYVVPLRFAAQPLLVEHLITGTEYLISAYIDSPEEITPLAIFAKEMSPEPYRQEIAYLADDYAAVWEQVRPVFAQLCSGFKGELRQCFVQCDLMISDVDQQVYLFDFSPRLVGNNVLFLQQYCHNSPIEFYVRHVLQKEQVPYHTPKKPAAMYFFDFAHTGTVRAINNCLSAAEMEHVVSLELNVQVGDKVGPMTNGNGVGCGHIIVAHDTLKEAQALAKKFMQSFVVEPD